MKMMVMVKGIDKEHELTDVNVLLHVTANETIATQHT